MLSRLRTDRYFCPRLASTSAAVIGPRESIAESGANSKAHMGAVMKIVQAKAAGRADGKTISAIVTRLLP